LWLYPCKHHKALQQLQQLDDEKGSMENVDDTTPIKFDNDDGISVALRNIESNNRIDDSLALIQSTARSLWWKRVGVLVALPNSIDFENIRDYQTKDLYNNDNIKQYTIYDDKTKCLVLPNNVFVMTTITK
jgi:hypothetical protein